MKKGCELMKKVFLVMMIGLALMLGLIACNKENSKTYTFRGKIVEMYMNNLIVEPLENEEIRRSADKIQVWIGQTPEFHPPIFPASTLVEIEYDGNVDETRAWWTQCEAVTGFLNGFSKSGDLKYLDAAVSVWNYIKNTLVDKRPGSEWYSEADADEIPVLNKPIVSEWKCPYHNIRMYIETIKRLGSYDDKEITEVLTMDGE